MTCKTCSHFASQLSLLRAVTRRCCRPVRLLHALSSSTAIQRSLNAVSEWISDLRPLHCHSQSRLGRIEIQSRSSLDRGHFLARYRCRRANFCVSYAQKTLFAYSRHFVCVEKASIQYRCRNRRHRLSVSGTALVISYSIH